MPNIEDWDFLDWFVAVCIDETGFDQIPELLITKHGFVRAFITKKDYILPIPGIDLEAIGKGDYNTRYHGWGVGRILIKNGPMSKEPSIDFKYFLDCPWNLIKDDPMKDANADVLNLIKPVRFLDYLAREIPRPY